MKLNLNNDQRKILDELYWIQEAKETSNELFNSEIQKKLKAFRKISDKKTFRFESGSDGKFILTYFS
jgi:hypothetical protein